MLASVADHALEHSLVPAHADFSREAGTSVRCEAVTSYTAEATALNPSYHECFVAAVVKQL
jgi:hypothetical protein